MPDAPAPPFRVFTTGLDPIEWTHGIAIAEIHAILETDRVVRFAELLDQDTLIDRALHERLDLVLVHAPTLDRASLAALAARAWASAGRQSR